MKIYNQWTNCKKGIGWGIALFSVFNQGAYYGFSILGFVFEWKHKSQ